MGAEERPDPIRYGVVVTPRGAVYVETLPVLAVVDQDDQPVRLSDGHLWTTTAWTEADNMVTDRNRWARDTRHYTDLGIDPPPADLLDVTARRWRVVVLR